jgi:hypothetical protein
VRNWIHSQLAPLCAQLEVEVTKSVIKMAAVQHLYGRLAGTLAPGAGDGDLLAALHPTPAVCGRPREAAMRWARGWAGVAVSRAPSSSCLWLMSPHSVEPGGAGRTMCSSRGGPGVAITSLTKDVCCHPCCCCCQVPG